MATGVAGSILCHTGPPGLVSLQPPVPEAAYEKKKKPTTLRGLFLVTIIWPIIQASYWLALTIN